MIFKGHLIARQREKVVIELEILNRWIRIPLRHRSGMPFGNHHLCLLWLLHIFHWRSLLRSSYIFWSDLHLKAILIEMHLFLFLHGLDGESRSVIWHWCLYLLWAWPFVSSYWHFVFRFKFGSQSPVSIPCVCLLGRAQLMNKVLWSQTMFTIEEELCQEKVGIYLP